MENFFISYIHNGEEKEEIILAKGQGDARRRLLERKDIESSDVIGVVKLEHASPKTKKIPESTDQEDSSGPTKFNYASDKGGYPKGRFLCVVAVWIGWLTFILGSFFQILKILTIPHPASPLAAWPYALDFWQIDIMFFGLVTALAGYLGRAIFDIADAVRTNDSP